MRQQLFFEDHLKDFANDRREANGLTWLGSVVRGFLRLGLPLRGTNLQGPGRFGVKG